MMNTLEYVKNVPINIFFHNTIKLSCENNKAFTQDKNDFFSFS